MHFLKKLFVLIKKCNSLFVQILEKTQNDEVEIDLLLNPKKQVTAVIFLYFLPVLSWA